MRAARLCPDCVFRDTVRTEADTAEVPLLFSDNMNVDRLLADCAQLHEAVSAERDLYRHALEQSTSRVQLLPPRTRQAVSAVRGTACTYEPQVYESDVVRVDVRPGPNGPLLSVEEKAHAIPCPPHAGKVVYVDREVKVGVAPWYRVFTWIVLAIVALGVCFVVALALRHWGGPTVTVLLMAISSTLSAQDWTRTESTRTYGERRLVLQGTFADADTALVQVYHDGDELHSEVYARTWSLTLGGQDQYWIKFTDGQGRVKRIAIHELSDDLVEFYPVIEVDFERIGNLVLIKQSTGKPDWQEFDVGLSRKRNAK